MPRRPPGDDDDVSLFPFLSIIACVIGVLTMMISTLALAQLDSDEVALIEEWEETQQALEYTDSQIAELTALINEQLGPDGADVREELAKRQAELDELIRQQEELKKQLEDQQKIEVVIPEIDESLRETAATMQAELERLQQEIAQLELDLQQRQDASKSKVSVLPAGSGLQMTPHFVECAQGAILLHDHDPPKLLRAAGMVTDEDFIGLLTTVANSSDESIIFLIRPDGLSAWRAAKKLCDERSIRNGKLPVAGDGKIDLSHFRQKDQ